jgi:hypothetical protein
MLVAQRFELSPCPVARPARSRGEPLAYTLEMGNANGGWSEVKMYRRRGCRLLDLIAAVTTAAYATVFRSI